MMTDGHGCVPAPDRRVAVAPMMDWTDRHARAFLRLVAPHARLYTEMVSTGAILHGDRARHLGFDASEHPVALQLGGGDPAELALCARAGADWGYDEVNLNVGCPSDRVRSGRFGACLMREPALVAECVAAMRAAVAVPVTVKCRIGVDEADGYDDLVRFVSAVAAAGCAVFIVHARKAVLAGLSPKQNREVPPLRPALVHRLKDDFPHLTVVVNGGITTAAQVQAHLARVDGVMIGREAYQNPWMLAALEESVFGAPPRSNRHGVLAAYMPYVCARLEEGVPLAAMTRHLLGLFNGEPGARAWRRHLGEASRRPGAGADVVGEASALVRERPPSQAVRRPLTAAEESAIPAAG